MSAAGGIAVGTGQAAVVVLALDTSVLVTGACLAGALLGAAVVIEVARRWRRRAGSETFSASDQLAHFRSLYEAGTISQEEFARLRALLGGQLRQSLKVPPPPPAPDTGIQTDGERPSPNSPGAGGGPSDTGIRPA
jgi:hypothetical protein